MTSPGGKGRRPRASSDPMHGWSPRGLGPSGHHPLGDWVSRCGLGRHTNFQPRAGTQWQNGRGRRCSSPNLRTAGSLSPGPGRCCNSRGPGQSLGLNPGQPQGLACGSLCLPFLPKSRLQNSALSTFPGERAGQQQGLGPELPSELFSSWGAHQSAGPKPETLPLL